MAGRTSSNPSGGTIRGMAGTSRTPAAIAVGLRALGVKRGDLLMVHASLRRLGPVESGARGVVEALAASELAIETAVAVRDRVVEAYQEILRMPV